MGHKIIRLTRKKVLLVAYACRPGESSEREVGWKWANLIQQNHDVTVLTRETHRTRIEAAVVSCDTAPSFLYYDLPKWASWYKRGGRGLYVYYVLWTFFAVRKARKMNNNQRWQITHFLTFGTLLWPQFFYRMNTAYLLGPVGGGERIPNSLRKSFRKVTQLKIAFRRLIQKLLFLNPFYQANLHCAGKIFARTHETMEMIPVRYRHKTELLLETAISATSNQSITTLRNNDTIHIIAVGRLISSKFNPLMFEALAEFKSTFKHPFKVTIIGDGPERFHLEELCEHLALKEVEFVGKQNSEFVFTALKRSDIYFSTTMKEAGTWAFFEAITYHVPVVCLKVNGPDMIIGEGCGIKVAPSSIAETRSALAKGLLTLAENPALRKTLADRAISHLQDNLTWQHVAQRVDNAYTEILETKK